MRKTILAALAAFFAGSVKTDARPEDELSWA